jgi:hypothetical protein
MKTEVEFEVTASEMDGMRVHLTVQWYAVTGRHRSLVLTDHVSVPGAATEAEIEAAIVLRRDTYLIPVWLNPAPESADLTAIVGKRGRIDGVGKITGTLR